MQAPPPVTTDLVLAGGGHAHLHVLTAFARRPVPGVRVTLVTRELETPYSGMLPGHVAGIYSRDDVHIDLARLAAVTGTRLIHAEAIGLDREARRLLLRDRPPLAYDLLSIDVGIRPALSAIEGADRHGIAVKPIGQFLDKLDLLLEKVQGAEGPMRIAVVGGGAGGVELILSLRARLMRMFEEAGITKDRLSFMLLTQGALLGTHNGRVRETFRRCLLERRIRLLEGRIVSAIEEHRIVLADGEAIDTDAVLLATEAAPPSWFAETGLALDPGGFLAVRPSLQALNDSAVFAAGDCAGIEGHERPKAGVYAVRAGPPLARNLRRALLGKKLRQWQPQKRNLALISTGEPYAVASRGWFKAEGASLWRLKDRIDRRWMRMYQDVERMRMPQPAAARASHTDPREEMRCGGCAAKIGPGPLAAALSRLPAAAAQGSVLIDPGQRDDAAITSPTPGLYSLHSVDFFRAFIQDPHLLGEIAAQHALNDIYAMGGTPRHALAMATVPYGSARIVEEDLFQLLAGALRCFQRESVELAGGHSAEGAEMAIGFSVTGEVRPEAILRKAGLVPGDRLILTRPLGTGILFAGLMRGMAPARSVEAALNAMRQSNRIAANLLIEAGARAMTDVTGFGLAGHLGEMLAASTVSAQIDPARIPVYPSARDLAGQGIVSTLLAENLTLRQLLRGEAEAVTLALLFDPQTSGGLLAGVPAGRAEAALKALHAAGYPDATEIGFISRMETNAGSASIALA